MRGYVLRGNAYGTKGDKSKAIVDYTHTIELDPKMTEAYAMRGPYTLSLGDLDGAIADYTRAIELDPKLGPVFQGRATARAGRVLHQLQFVSPSAR
jgi:lipoprotein NlpI